jgi:hypothetical protein
MYADGPFCRIEITYSLDHGEQVWAVRDPARRIEPAHTLVDTLPASYGMFHPQWYQGAMRAPWYVPVTELA